jgi:hypothetical protein
MPHFSPHDKKWNQSTDLTELPMSEPVHPELGQRLHDTLLQVVEMEETFQIQHKLSCTPHHGSG